MTDLTDAALYAQGLPHALLARLRRESPVFWHEAKPGEGFWAVLRHDDVIAVSRDHETFSVALGGVFLADQPPAMVGSLLTTDPPEHTRLRRAVQDAFTNRALAEIEGWLQERAAALMAAAARRGRLDFVRELAAELPLQTINQMMAIPEADRGRLLELGDAVIRAPANETQRAMAELGAYGYQLAQQRADASGRDLVSQILRAAQSGGRPLVAEEFAALFMQIAVAANETTRSLLSAGLFTLLERPERYAALRAEPALLPGAVEELLRFTTPIYHFRRTAARDAVLRGQQIRAGQRVLVFYISANFDERVFQDPLRFDPRRAPNPHLSFGFGEHFCLGARLARMEARIFLAALLQRFERVELDGEPQRLPSNLTNSWLSIPIRVHEAAH